MMGNQITAKNCLDLWGLYSSSWEMSYTRDLHDALGQGESQGELLVPGLLRASGRPAKVFSF